MTVAIQRQPRFHRVLLVVGLIALVAWLAVTMTQMVEPEMTSGDPAPAQTSRQVGPGTVVPAIQDGYLTPQAILRAQAAREAELRLQNGYLPPAALSDPAGVVLLFIQDGYLPPAEDPTDSPVRPPVTGITFTHPRDHPGGESRPARSR